MLSTHRDVLSLGNADEFANGSLELSFYAGKSVFLTGHTGFKGGWLTAMLRHLGASIHGYALVPETQSNLFGIADIQSFLSSHTLADLADSTAMLAAMRAAQPEIVFHLAAQPLVRRSYIEPALTWQTNVQGTVNLLECVRQCPSVRAVVIITTDKCYENQEWHWGYRENDHLGGHDPYSASKAACELVVNSYRASFFNASGVRIASARAGNVIGGGDWAADRLIPDAVRAIAVGQMLQIRNPAASRPWQHVLAPLHGYLLLGKALLCGQAGVDSSFNFGPSQQDNLSVVNVLKRLQGHWPELELALSTAGEQSHESQLLYLDSSKAQHVLGWQSRWNLAKSLEKTAGWYRAEHAGNECMQRYTLDQIEEYFL
ncbi:CDP-glucose 4,6-dehydratase [Deefgea tanakiae]|uniref:CDP-glucose 4,6-dehydratase n=1 Tax=Deefgea tanakiae TaxID=2865840 RepID=A0ABX8Z9H3_9NEIS|nr:CDP-glucose 4,6-dehydratase [Deefgea tanakiae]QZA79211.1 CDP-glucose 4,6-dehydratase [Deefgea tanakiae]